MLDSATTRVDGLRSLTRSLRTSEPASPPDPRRVLADIGDRHVITFFTAHGDLWRIVTRGTAAPRIERVGSAAEFASLVEQMLANPDDSATLGERLLANALPARDVPVYVVVDEPIHHVPLAALRVDGDYLIRRNPIALVPNAAVLARLTQAKPRTGGVLVVGDSSNDLPGARLEAAAVAKTLSTTPLLGTAANRASVIAAAGARVLHLATHARAT
jgi:hypothetical protein